MNGQRENVFVMTWTFRNESVIIKATNVSSMLDAM